MSTLEVKAIQAPTGYNLAMPAGHILQTVHSTRNIEQATSSTTFQDTNLEATITPKFTTSKILVIFSLNGISKESSDTSLKVQTVYNIAGGSDTGATSFGTRNAYTGGSDKIGIGSVSGSLLLDLDTTSAVQVKVQFASNSGTASAQVHETSATSTILLQEVAQ